MVYPYWKKTDVQYINKTLDKLFSEFKYASANYPKVNYQIETDYGRYTFVLDNCDRHKIYMLAGRFDYLTPEQAQDLNANLFSYKWNHHWAKDSKPDDVIIDVVRILANIGAKGFLFNDIYKNWAGWEARLRERLVRL